MKKFTQILSKYQFSSSNGTQIGFIGLGNMGSGMAKNLQKAGNKVQVFDVSPETRQKFREEGFNVAEKVEEIANNPNIQTVITMVPAKQHVKELCDGPTGLFSLLKKGSMIIDCSTIGPLAAKEMSQLADQYDQEFYDAPVSGGITGAANGTLTFMVGSKNLEQFEKVKSILEPMAGNIFDCKQVAGGQITKAVNNMALAIQMISVSEALTMGQKLGMDPKTLSDIMNTATGQCWSLSKYNPAPGVLEGVPSSRNWEGGFASQLMLKDLGLALECASDVGASIPLGEHSQQIYQQIVENGLGNKDFSIVYEQLLKNKL